MKKQVEGRMGKVLVAVLVLGAGHALAQAEVTQNLDRVQVFATTPPTQVPLLVSSPATPRDEVDRLRQALAQVEHEPGLADARAALLLRRFSTVDAHAYATLREPAGNPLV